MSAAALHADAAAPGRLGPNSVLQLVPVLDAAFGELERQRLLDLAGLPTLPEDAGLMDEAPAARLHQLLRSAHPQQAPTLLAAAGALTGDYIIRHRIPAAAVALLGLLPRALAAPLLTRAIASHAWTFAGSATFQVHAGRPLAFTLTDNPIVRGETAKAPLCHWHAAVFERLFRRLVDDRYRCHESECAAAGGTVCRFVLTF